MENKLKTSIYSGKDLLNTSIFGFYWNNYEGNNVLKYKKSMDNIVRSFKKKYMDIISNKLSNIGLKLIDVTYFSPREYNYRDDELDFHIKIIDLKRYLDFLKKNNLINEETFEMETSINYYDPDVNEMSEVFKLLKLTADDLNINVEIIYDNLEFDMRYKENRL